MKLATFNVNGIASRLKHLLQWLEKESPDVVCLQELKAPETGLPVKAIRDAGYGALWRGQKSGNGGGVLAKGAGPGGGRGGVPGAPQDEESRYLGGAVQGITVGRPDFPHGKSQAGPN